MANAVRNDLTILHPGIAVAGRVMFTLIFFLSGITHFTRLDNYAALMPAAIPRGIADRSGADEFHRFLDRVAGDTATGDTSVLDNWRQGKSNSPI